MRLRRPARSSGPAPLTSIIDVLLILLFFFMVTSSYLELDMVPLLAGDAAPVTDAPAPADVPAPADAPAAPAQLAVLVRLDPAGAAWIGGRQAEGEALVAALRDRLAARPGLPVLILPSPRADVQALVRAMEAASRAGATSVRVMRPEARPDPQPGAQP